MPPDPRRAAGDDARVKLTQQWMEKARHDLLTADRMAQPETVPDVVVFPCQQAAEKALKAYLTWRDRPFRRTHELGDLLSECVMFDDEFRALQEAADTLTPYAVDPRYPGEDMLPSIEEMAEARHLSQSVVAFVLQRLPDHLQQ
jgi:HEPN domain-containing protein